MAVTTDDQAPDSTPPGRSGPDNDELRAKFAKWDKELDSHWKAWAKEAKEAFDMVAGRQWKKEDEQAMEANKRAPVVFNRIGPMIDSVAGTEIQGRQQVQYLPRVQTSQPIFGQIPQMQPPASPGAAVGAPGGLAPSQPGAPPMPMGQPAQPQPDPNALPPQSAADEILTKGADWIRDQCDAAHEESDAFRDALICGVGWTETRMDYEEEPEGKILVERVDPLEVLADCRSKKPNFADAKYVRRQRKFTLDDFKERWPNSTPTGVAGDNNPVAINDPRHRYENDEIEGEDDDSVTVREYQWFEREAVHIIDGAGGLTTMSADEHEALGERAPESQKVFTRRYYRAFVAGTQILDVGPLPDGEFTLKAVTGKRDRNKGYWYGLVRPMMDPQRYANKFMSQLLHILNSNAKGGLIATADAFADQRQAEESWAKADTITWANPGALEGKIQPKVAPPIPQALPMMMDWAVSAIRDSTGINQELLGMTDREQPGVLEQQRKESAYAILAPFFDSLRRYRKIQGRLLLKYIQKYLPAGTLVRIVDDQGLAKYVPLAKQPDTAKFDVVVDEGPAGPNEKRQVFQLLSQFMPLLERAGPEVMAEITRWAPFPATLSNKLAQLITQGAQQSSQPTPEQQSDMAEAQAKAARDQAGAAYDQARAQKTQVETAMIGIVGPVPGTGM